MSKSIPMWFKVLILATVSCALWGSAVPLVRLGYQLFEIDANHIPSQLMFAGVRFFLAGLFVLIFFSVKTKQVSFSLQETRIAFVISLFQTIGQYVLYYIGLAHVTGVNGAIIQGVGIFVAVILSCVVYRMERFTFNKVAGCLLGVLGLVATSGFGFLHATSFSFFGEGFLVLASVCGAQSSILMKKYAQTINPYKLCGMQFFIGGLLLSIVAFVLGARFEISNFTQLFVLLWLVMVSGVAFSIWSVLLRDYDVSRVMMYRFLIPIFGVVFSLLLLGTEGANLGIHTGIGLACICFGILWVQKPTKNTIPIPKPAEHKAM